MSRIPGRRSLFLCAGIPGRVWGGSVVFSKETLFTLGPDEVATALDTFNGFVTHTTLSSSC
jgi:hypothetical protein